MVWYFVVVVAVVVVFVCLSDTTLIKKLENFDKETDTQPKKYFWGLPKE